MIFHYFRQTEVKTRVLISLVLEMDSIAYKDWHFNPHGEALFQWDYKININ